LAALSFGGAIAIASLFFAFVDGAAGAALALGAFAFGAGSGVLLLRGAGRSSEKLAAGVRAKRERALLELAEKNAGVLDVTSVARGLGLSLAEAEASLIAISDGSRVIAEVTSDGRIEYVFRELGVRAMPVRVELDAPPTAVEEVEAPGARSRRQEPR
ncbi:MAG: hypothetical protein H5U40_03470, partial [Polyangiaceae bacterium]|nr:hypothetical protein [Polyangiaceae bacterium]